MQQHVFAPDNFAGTFETTISQLSIDARIDGTYLWRIGRGERVEVSREVLMLIGIAMVLDKDRAEEVVEIANRLLDAAG